MYGIVNMTAHVKNEVFADNAHKVGPHHAHIVVGSIFAEIGVDGRKTLGDCSGTFKSGLVAKHDFQAVFIAPAHGFVSNATGAHAAADAHGHHAVAQVAPLQHWGLQSERPCRAH